MKKFLIFLFVLSLKQMLLSQEVEQFIHCGFDTLEAQMHQLNPIETDNANAAHENFTQHWIEENLGTDENVDDFYSNAAIIIPVVVHVVYNPNHPEQNITDAQIHSQIRVLNEDFERGNTDAINTPNDFLGKAADTRIRFTLAQSDPNCNPTNGIVRIATSVNTDIAPFDLVI